MKELQFDDIHEKFAGKEIEYGKQTIFIHLYCAP